MLRAVNVRVVLQTPGFQGVDSVGSMREGMTISFPSAATPAASVLPTGFPFFTSRSGGPRGDMSVLSGFTAPAVLSGRRSLYVVTGEEKLGGVKADVL